MNLKTALTFFIAGLCLTACNDDVKTVEYYKTHEKERSAMIEKCQTMEPKDKNCSNASAALAEVMFSTMPDPSTQHEYVGFSGGSEGRKLKKP